MALAFALVSTLAAEPRFSVGVCALRVAQQFKGKVRMYEVWNEWDIGIGRPTPGTSEAYARLLKTVYPRVKAIDRASTVLGGCPTSGGIREGWLRCFGNRGA